MFYMIALYIFYLTKIFEKIILLKDSLKCVWETGREREYMCVSVTVFLLNDTSMHIYWL